MSGGLGRQLSKTAQLALSAADDHRAAREAAERALAVEMQDHGALTLELQTVDAMHDVLRGHSDSLGASAPPHTFGASHSSIGSPRSHPGPPLPARTLPPGPTGAFGRPPLPARSSPRPPVPARPSPAHQSGSSSRPPVPSRPGPAHQPGPALPSRAHGSSIGLLKVPLESGEALEPEPELEPQDDHRSAWASSQKTHADMQAAIHLAESEAIAAGYSAAEVEATQQDASARTGRKIYSTQILLNQLGLAAKQRPLPPLNVAIAEVSRSLKLLQRGQGTPPFVLGTVHYETEPEPGRQAQQPVINLCELTAKLMRGEAAADTLVWVQGFAKWTTLANVLSIPSPSDAADAAAAAATTFAQTTAWQHAVRTHVCPISGLSLRLEAEDGEGRAAAATAAAAARRKIAGETGWGQRVHTPPLPAARLAQQLEVALYRTAQRAGTQPQPSLRALALATPIARHDGARVLLHVYDVSTNQLTKSLNFLLPVSYAAVLYAALTLVTRFFMAAHTRFLLMS